MGPAGIEGKTERSFHLPGKEHVEVWVQRERIFCLGQIVLDGRFKVRA